MKEDIVFLHPSKKKLWILLILTISFISLTFAFSIFCMRTNFSQLNALVNSTYLYSAEMKEVTSNDCYIKYNASIEFSVSSKAESTIFADSIMQVNDTCYTDIIWWNAQPLKINAVAISMNLAQKYNLNVGDVLYSKHIVTGKTCEYCISEIIPDVVNSRINDNCIQYDGIIIMGYDELYHNNISHKYLSFSKSGFDDAIIKEIGSVENILYRKNEIRSVIQKLLPYACISILIAISVAIIYVEFMVKNVKKYYLRLMTLGFSQKRLNASLNKLLYIPNLILVLILLLIFTLVCAFASLSSLSILWIAGLSLVELLSLLIFCKYIKRQLWR